MVMVDKDEREMRVMLGVLTAVESDSGVTQRKIAQELGIALGLANLYLRRCVKKGWIKISEAPLNRLAYYLTPHGFAEKSTLTARYLSYSLGFFRTARRRLDDLFGEAEARGWRRILLIGAGDLAEIAVLSASGRTVTIIGILDAAAAPAEAAGLPVVAAPAQPFDAAILTGLDRSEAVLHDCVALLAAAGLPADRLLVPALFGPPPPVPGEALRPLGGGAGAPLEAAS